MATVRINGTTPHNIHKQEWLGALHVDLNNHIERSVDLPEIVYQRIEEGVTRGHIQGILFLDDGRRIEWLLDRAPLHAEPGRNPAAVGCGEGI